MFIVFEGTDGSGTSTQAMLLKEFLEKKGIPVLKTAEPSQSHIGKNIRKILTDHTPIDPIAFQLLFFADRKEHLKNEILPALKKGKIVICERYIWSSLAYGAAEGIDIEYLKNIAKEFTIPDYTFFCHLDAAESLERVKKRGNPLEKFEELYLLEKVQKNMTSLCKEKAFTKQCTKLESRENQETIAKKVEKILSTFFL